MAPEQARTQQELTAGDLVEHLVQFEGPPQQFLLYLLAVQCRLASADSAVILRPGPEQDLQVVAVYPPPERPDALPGWVAQAGEAAGSVAASGKTAIVPVHDPADMYGDAPGQHLIMLPIRHLTRAEVRGVSAFLIRTRDAQALRAGQERLELSSPLLSLYEIQLTLQRRDLDMARLRDALEVVSALNRHDRFGAAAMTLCNEFASRWSASRVSLGFVRGRGIRLSAISHTENFSRKMQLVQDIESAMEECLDQDLEVIHPAPAEAPYVSRAAAKLSERQGPSVLCSFPLRHGGDVQAVLTVEKARESPLDAEGVESMRLAADLATARVVSLHEHDRWFGAKAAGSVRRTAAALVGPRHTWAKLLAIGIAALAVFLVFAEGRYTVKAPCVLQAQQRQVIPAAFDGILESVQVDLGQPVRAGQPLARLETADLELQLRRAQAERTGYEKESDKAMRDRDTNAAQMAQSQADKVQAEINIIEEQIRRADLRAPIDGFVVAGDLKQKVGAPVKRGETLFEVAPVEYLRAELLVDEKDVHDVRADQTGELATAGRPGQKVPFVVETVSPLAEVVERSNVFKVRVRLTGPHGWMLPGMEGIAQVSVDHRRYAWLWTHRLVDWVRLKLWL